MIKKLKKKTFIFLKTKTNSFLEHIFTYFLKIVLKNNCMYIRIIENKIIQIKIILKKYLKHIK